jgi:hypothetical protein
MNFGGKLQILYKSMNFKNWQEFGKFVDISGEWCLEKSKKKELTIVEVDRIIKICNKFNVTKDWLLSDDDTSVIEIKEGYSDNDIGTMLDKIILQVKEPSQYYGTNLNKTNSVLIADTIEEVKRLIQDNL